MSELEQLTGPICHHGEGPFWSPTWDGLRFIDMRDGDVMHLDPSGSVSRHHVGERIACIRPSTDGGAVLGLAKEFATLDATSLAAADGLATPVTAPLWSTPDLWFNEGAVDPYGRFWCGSATDEGLPGAGSMYRLDPSTLAATKVFDGVAISNGLAWTAAGDVAYYVDSATHGVARLVGDLASGDLRPEPWIHIPHEDSEPDGLCVDAAGNVWVAMWGGSCVRHYSPNGELLARIPVPAPHVTACTLGGDDLRTLFITTSQLDLELSDYPESGSLFSLRVDGAGFTPTMFGQ